jgi:hypothetical protein
MQSHQVVMTADAAEEIPALICARCAAELEPGTGSFYLIHIEAIADPTPPIVSAEDLAADLRQRIEELIAQMAGMSEQEAMDQIYRRLTLHLCTSCYRTWIENPVGPSDAG